MFRTYNALELSLLTLAQIWEKAVQNNELHGMKPRIKIVCIGGNVDIMHESNTPDGPAINYTQNAGPPPGTKHQTGEAANIVHLNDKRPGLHPYCPEMGQRKPQAIIEAFAAYATTHYYLDTSLELKGKGITLQTTYTAADLTPEAQYKVGWHRYYVTQRAFNKLKEQYAIAILDKLD